MQEITKIDDFLETLNNTPETLVYFGRRHGCVPCKQLEPHLTYAAQGITAPVIKVYMDECDTDLFAHIYDEYVVRGTPTLIKFKHDAPLHIMKGRTAPLIIAEYNNV